MQATDLLNSAIFLSMVRAGLASRQETLDDEKENVNFEIESEAERVERSLIGAKVFQRQISLFGTKNGICHLKIPLYQTNFIQVVLSRAVRNSASVFRRYRSPLHRLRP